jgi:poly-gamma-glutamate capsule biosynthesis protein CapA/YwtB (metallophosphatase superfamily)
MDWLKHHSLHTSGVGINRAEAEQPLAITIGNNSVSILSFAAFPKDRKGFNAEKQAVASSSRPGMLWADSETITATAPLLGQPNNDQNHQKSRSSVTVALIHAGIEYAHVPNQKTRQIFQSLASHGWNLVIGSHPHVLQGFEVYKGSLIFYSLGNFIFPGMDEMYRAEESVLVRIGLFDNKILYFEPIGVRLHSRGVNLDKSQQILTRWYKQSKALN